MTLCDRCHAPFPHTAVDLYLAACGLVPLPRMDGLCRSLHRLDQRRARSHIPTAEQQEGMRAQYAMAVHEAAQHTAPRATRASILALVALWVQTHDGALPVHQHFTRRGQMVGISALAMHREFGTIMELYRVCLAQHLCTEAAVLQAAYSMRRSIEGRALVQAHRRATYAVR